MQFQKQLIRKLFFWVGLLFVLFVIGSTTFATRHNTVSRATLPANFNLLPGPQAVVPMPIEVVDPNPDAVRLRFTDPPLEINTVNLKGTDYQSIRLTGESATLNPGEPELPRVTRMIMVGNTGNVRLQITDQSFTTQNNVHPAPLQILDGDEGARVDGFVPPDASVYSRDEWYPSTIAEISEPTTLRDIRFVVVTTYPVQINPVTGQMRVYDNIEVLVENAGGVGANEIHFQPTSITPSFKKMYSQFENFAGSSLDELPVYPGNMLIIGRDQTDVNAQGPLLANWYKRKGVNATYVNTTTIGGTDATTIHNYIGTTYANSGGLLEFVTLIGDPDGGQFAIPAHSTQYDNYYGTLTSGGSNPDPVPDLSVGRLPVSSQSDLLAIVKKTINYQTQPDTSDRTWFTRGWCAAHTNYALSNPATKEYTRQIMLQHGLNPVTMSVYSGSISTTDLYNQLNTGISVFNDRMSWNNEFYPSALNGIPQTFRLPFVMVITCESGDYVGETGLTEEWLHPPLQTLATPAGAIGAVGLCGTSTHVPYNNIVDAGVMYGMYVLGVEEQGTALVDGKLQLYKNYETYRSSQVDNFCYWANLQGDAAVPIWRIAPGNIDAIRPSQINLGTNNVAITVVKAGGLVPITNALVCLWKGTETYARGYTNSAGQINLPVTTTTTGDMLLTITKDNIYPKLDTIRVVTSAASLAFNTITVDDDNLSGTIGDNNHVLNPGETIDLTINLRNAGTSTTITGISGTLTSSIPGVQVTDATKTYPNIAAGANANATTPYRIHVSSVFNGEPVTLYLNLTSSVGAQTVRIDLTPVAGNVTYVSSAFSGPGNNLDPGETGNLTVTFRNSGARTLTTSTGLLRSMDPLIFVNDSIGDYGTVAVAANSINSSNPFNISINWATYNGHNAPMQLIISDANGFRDSTNFVLSIGTLTSTSPTGPDGFGYYAYDNTETTPQNSACTYSWVEIAPGQGGTGTSLNLLDTGTDLDRSTVVTLPFSFTFYGVTTNQLTVCSNGWIAFGSYSTFDDFRNYRMGTPIGPPYQVAAYWDELITPDGNNNVYTKFDAANHIYIIEWRAKLCRQSGNPPEIFEVILYDPTFYPSASGNGKIKVQYNTVNLNANYDDNDNDYASAGIQNGDHSIGLDYYYWNTYSSVASAPLVTGRAIMYTTDASGALVNTLSLSAPDGGENYTIAKTYSITWSSTGIPGTINISLNRNYPSGTWENVILGTPNDNLEAWTVSGPITSNARLRIISVEQPSVGDTSNANFSIVLPTMSLLTPNGGDSTYLAQAYPITWTSTGFPSLMNISLNRNYPSGAWESLFTGTPNDNSETWTITGAITSNARIRIISVDYPTVGDTSDANFKILMPSLTLLNPNGGEIWPQSTPQNIAWTSTGLGPVKVELNRNYPSSTWEIVDSANVYGQLDWYVTSPPTINARIRVSGTLISTVGDTSSANFTIGTAPMIVHEPHADQALTPATFTAVIFDEATVSAKLFLRIIGNLTYDSLAFSPTGNPQEYSVVTGTLAAGNYEYFIRATDQQNLSTVFPLSENYTFEVGNLPSSWLSYDDGTAENYNWVYGPDYQWAVKFTPSVFPFTLYGAKFAVCPTKPDTLHQAIILTVYLADGAGGLPGTAIWSDTTGSPTNVIGGLPAGPAWADVVIRNSGTPLSINSAFYLSVKNMEQFNLTEAFATDTNSTRSHMSFLFDACDNQWFNEDIADSNARHGNRMIRACGFSLVPPSITIRKSGTNDIVISWNSTNAPYYKIYKDTNPTGTFTELVGSTSSTSFTDTGRLTSDTKLFYRVVASDTP